MNFNLLLFTAFALCTAPAFATNLRGNGKGRILAEDIQGTFLVSDIQYDEGNRRRLNNGKKFKSDQTLNVEFADGTIYELKNINPAFSGTAGKSGNAITIPRGSIVSGAEVDLKGGKPDFVPGNNGKNPFQRRKLATVTGTKPILAVRVITTGTSPAQGYGLDAQGVTVWDENHLSNKVFGTGGDTVNLATQYKACSADKLDIVPSIHPNLPNDAGANNVGVITITLPNSATDGDGVLRNAVSAAINSQFSVSSPRDLADHVMYCLPAASMGGIAYAYINSWNSVYSNDWCNYPSVQLHEIGHNLNLAHAGEGSNAYGDQSGFMGYSYSQDTQQMCFNAAKNWQLGWYSQRHVELASGSWAGNLFGIADYATTSSDEKMIVQIPGSAHDVDNNDYYVSFNRKSGVNSNTKEGDNQVLVHQRAPGTGYGASTLMAKLSSGTTYVLSPWTITVNSIGTTSASVDINSCDDGLACTDDIWNAQVGQCENPAKDCSVGPCAIDQCVEGSGPFDGCQFSCGATLEFWTGIVGTSIIDLMAGTNNLANDPNDAQRLDSLLQAPTDYGNDYGARMKGWIVPPVTGLYDFWIASDDNGQLWLSTDVEESNKVQIAFVSSWTSPEQWDKLTGQQTAAPISLVAGQAYYYEALMKEGGGGDNLALAWQYPGQAREVIPASSSLITKPDVVATPQPTSTPSNPPTADPTANPTSATPTGNPTPQPTSPPTNVPTSPPSSPPSSAPTSPPSAPPTADPTASPTSAAPTSNPTTNPTKPPTNAPTPPPTFPQTPQPTSTPTAPPTADPTASPTSAAPTRNPTANPTKLPTNVPTSPPTSPPSSAPTSPPSAPPTADPTANPTSAAPTPPPSPQPTSSPTTGPPTSAPTNQPSSAPTSPPTSTPTSLLTPQPTSKPTVRCLNKFEPTVNGCPSTGISSECCGAGQCFAKGGNAGLCK